MFTTRKLMTCALVPLVLAFGATADAQGIGRSELSVGPSSTAVVVSMDKLTPGQRDQAVPIKTKMIQIEMEHEQAVAQMDMKYQQSMTEMQRQLMELYRRGVLKRTGDMAPSTRRRDMHVELRRAFNVKA
ncbi:hypothetical protein SB861_42650 [Paraburkholderia sp. SIMBA_049]